MKITKAHPYERTKEECFTTVLSFPSEPFKRNVGAGEPPLSAFIQRKPRQLLLAQTRGPGKWRPWHPLSAVEFGWHLPPVYIVMGCQEVLSGGHKLSSPIILSDKI